MILQPQEFFTIVRQLPDPSDSSTYYVRAVIRNARTDVIIDTINLTDRGSRRFSLPWQTPADTSGLGFYIAVCTSVYTDAGYTIKSDSYGEEMQTYLIDNRFRNLGGGGGGDGVDYTKLRKILKEVLTTFEWSSVFSLSSVLEAIKALGVSKLGQLISKSNDKLDVLQSKIDHIGEGVDAIEPAEPTDLTPVLQAIADKPVTPAAGEVNFTPILEAISAFRDAFDTTDIQAIVKEMPEVAKNTKGLMAKTEDLVYVLGKHAPELQKQAVDFFSQMPSKTVVKPVEVPKPDYEAISRDIVGIK